MISETTYTQARHNDSKMTTTLFAFLAKCFLHWRDTQYSESYQLSIRIRFFFIWHTYNESSKLTLRFIHQNLIKNRKFLLQYSHNNNKIQKNLTSFCLMPRKWLKFSTNQSSVKLNLKVEMWPVNALHLEWCYDTGNVDKHCCSYNR